ncbi:MAG: response regulator [bacterium]
MAQTILIVEDLPDVRATIVEMLKRGGYEVLEAANGREALKLLDQKTPTLILTDIIMPEMDGLEIIRKLTELKPNLPIVVFTAAANATYLRVAMKFGAVYGLHKPFSQAELLTTLQKALSKSRQ